MQSMEFAVLNWIQLHCRSEALDAVLPFVSWICDHGEVWILLAVILLAFKKTRRTGAVVAVALALDVVCCNLLLKPLIGRVRPFVVNPAVELLVSAPMDASFPSGHTASSFAAAAALRAAGSRLWLPAFVLAALIAFSRLYLYVHWPSDVLAGGVLGIFLGFAGDRVVSALERWGRRGKNA